MVTSVVCVFDLSGEVTVNAKTPFVGSTVPLVYVMVTCCPISLPIASTDTALLTFKVYSKMALLNDSNVS